MTLVRCWFQLKGGVSYREMFFQTRLQGVEYPRRIAAIEATVFDHHVRGQRGEVRRDRPGVQIVNATAHIGM